MNYVRSRGFCGMGKATKLGKTVQNFTKWCNVSTKVISKTKLLMRDQKYQKKKVAMACLGSIQFQFLY